MKLTELAALAAPGTEITVLNLDHGTVEYSCTAGRLPEEVLDFELAGLAAENGKLIAQVRGYEFGC